VLSSIKPLTTTQSIPIATNTNSRINNVETIVDRAFLEPLFMVYLIKTNL